LKSSIHKAIDKRINIDFQNIKTTSMKIQIKGMFFSLMLPLIILTSSAIKLSVSVSDEVITETESVTTIEKEEATYYNCGNLPMNRKGVNIKWRLDVKARYNGAHTGFLFDLADNATLKWRPQGITGRGKKVNNKSFLIVSWYGRKESAQKILPKSQREDYTDRGARISIINTTNMDKIKYRNVLLVDENLKPFAGCHAGGLAVVGDKLHVADSRGSSANPLADGSYDKVLVFDLTKIEKISSPVKKYSYVLRMESSYNSPINPGYLSYNKADDEMMIGSFTCNDAGDCKEQFSTGLAKFVFGKPNSIDRNTSFTTLETAETKTSKQFRQIQGMSTFTYNGKKYLVTSHSFASAKSALNFFAQKNGEWEWINKKTIDASGLEDVYVSSKNIWSVSEFSPLEAKFADRAVTAWKISKMVN
jgi:hypothetical protein